MPGQGTSTGAGEGEVVHAPHHYFPAIVVVAAALVILVMQQTVLPIVVGWILSLILAPMTHWLRVQQVPAPFPALIPTVLGSVIAALLFVFIAMVVVEQLTEFIAFLPELAAEIALLFRDSAVQPAVDQVIAEMPKEPAEAVAQNARDLAPVLLTLTGQTLTAALLAALTPFVTFFLLKDEALIRERMRHWLGVQRYRQLRRFWVSAKLRLSEFLKGQFMVCTVQAVLHVIGLKIIGLDYAVAIGIATGVLTLIPFIGNFSMFMLALAVAVLQFESIEPVLAVVAVFAASEVLETAVLAPMLVGRRINVHPLVIMVVLLVGGAQFGVIGALLSLPAAAVLAALFDHLDPEPEPPAEVEPTQAAKSGPPAAVAHSSA